MEQTDSCRKGGGCVCGGEWWKEGGGISKRTCMNDS